MNRPAVSWVLILLVAVGVLLTVAGCSEDRDASQSPAAEGGTIGSDAAAPPDPAKPMGRDAQIIFLHHSTGGVIWDGGVSNWFDDYNASHGTNYKISERAYPSEPYPWDNYPYDYWNIWVKHAGDRRYRKQDTLETLTKDYNVVVWKHCFPVSEVLADTGSPKISSDRKSIENYTLQYEVLREKMRQFPDTRFVVWTGAALVADATNEENARRAQQFFDWVKESWDEPGDNVFVWDFWQLETEGGLYLLGQYAAGPGDSHPSGGFAQRVAPYFAQRVVDVIEGRGDTGSLTGQ